MTDKYFGSDDGLTIINSAGTAFVTSEYNSGIMNGDIKGAWLADTVAETITGSEEITNGTFDTDINSWTDVSTGTGSVTWSSGAILLDGTDSSNRAVAYQSTVLELGKTYTLSLDASINSGTIYFGLDSTEDFTPYKSIAADDGFNEYTFTVTTTQTQVYLWTPAGGGSGTFDNVSLRLAEQDRSVNNKCITVHGTLTKSPVAPGAELVAYSGFSATDYLEQPYNPDLDFGTGDFYVMGWVKHNPTYNGSNDYILSRGTHIGYALKTQWDNVTFYANGNPINLPYPSVGSGWFFIVCGVKNGNMFLHVDQNAADPIATTGSVDIPNSTLLFGEYALNSGYQFDGALALWRIGAGAPTADQIKAIYESERHLFQEGAACTLYGSSDAVTALAHDPVTDLLHVGTSDGRSVFKGLQRVENTTDGINTVISAVDSFVIEE